MYEIKTQEFILFWSIYYYVYYLVDDKDPFLPLPPSQFFLTIVESWPD